MTPSRLPGVLVFDVNETLTDMAPLAARLTQVGLPADMLPVWFAGVLRDGTALTLAGGYASFADIADGVLRTLLARHAPASDPDDAVGHVLGALPLLPLHPDVPDGVRALRAAGHRLLTLTNGSAATTRAVLGKAGLTDCFEAHLDVGAPRAWKPAPAAYAHVLRAAGVPAPEAMMVAVHPWDVDGAGRAGLATAWLRRKPGPYPAALRTPDRTADGVSALARGADGGA